MQRSTVARRFPARFAAGRSAASRSAAGALMLSLACGGGVAAADTVVLTIDGRDSANVAGDGNHATFHNPPVNFAFTFGGVSADNPTVGPGDPPTAADTDFNFTGSDFGGLGFGTASAGDFSCNTALARFEMDVTVNGANTLASLVLNLKDADAPGHLVEEHQYNLALGAAGTKTLTAMLSTPAFTNTPRDGVVNFDPGNGLTEIQLQYPFSAGGSGAVLNVTIHEMRIVEVPEPSTVAAVAAFACAIALRRVARSRRTLA
jgi:hypothetical protein